VINHPKIASAQAFLGGLEPLRKAAAG
jgi:hypothetical protein